jgi:spore maturation protein CgeB
MSFTSMKIVMLGLSITSSWGNGHATTYRGLVRELADLGHDVLFLERDMPWYAGNRDMPALPSARTELYTDLEELDDRFMADVKEADLVLLGSYVPEGVRVAERINRLARGVKAFYDIDTPVTLAKLEVGDFEYLTPDLIPQFDLYLSFTGGPILQKLETQYGARRAKAFYCSADPSLHYPEDLEKKWELGYLGTYSDDRQHPLDLLMIQPARLWPEGRFVVAGPQYPDHVRWPDNMERIQHLPPCGHRSFYNAQKFTLNITRAEMVRAGYSPSVRLFEAAACGTPIISDYWEGLDEVFEIGSEILISRSPEETTNYLMHMPEDERIAVGERARARVLVSHTAAHRAAELDALTLDLLNGH